MSTVALATEPFTEAELALNATVPRSASSTPPSDPTVVQQLACANTGVPAQNRENAISITTSVPQVPPLIFSLRFDIDLLRHCSFIKQRPLRQVGTASVQYIR